MTAKITDKRTAGVLMPVASLPSRYGVGSLGAECRRFIDILAESGVSVWQILPLNPLGYGNSPYQALSSFAGDECYVDLEELKSAGLIKSRLRPMPRSGKHRIDYQRAKSFKEKYLREASAEFYKTAPENRDFRRFLKNKWVYDYAVFVALKKQNGLVQWSLWPEEQRDWILDKKYDISHLKAEIDYQIFLQYAFVTQWRAIKRYANKKGLAIMGDVPFYVGFDSLDVWADRESFLLDERYNPTLVAGVPPDCFNDLGQRWGNPIYNWERLRENGFKFWIDRIRAAAGLYDIVRIDHFRAFDTYWVVPAENETAVYGEWREAPGYELFDKIFAELPGVNIVAEDLGDLRPQVLELRDHFGLMGMNIAEFTLHEPWKFTEYQIVYPGNHDNQPANAWYKMLSGEDKRIKTAVLDKYGERSEPVSIKLMRLVMASPARMAILPMADILNKGDEARLNSPGTVGSPNWEWRLDRMESFEEKTDTLRTLIKDTGRWRR